MPVFSYEQLRKMNPGEFRVYNFMVSHLEMVPEMNIRQIAGGAGVSATTVLRFCEKAGCSGSGRSWTGLTEREALMRTRPYNI